MGHPPYFAENRPGLYVRERVSCARILTNESEKKGKPLLLINPSFKSCAIEPFDYLYFLKVICNTILNSCIWDIPSMKVIHCKRIFGRLCRNFCLS